MSGLTVFSKSPKRTAALQNFVQKKLSSVAPNEIEFYVMGGDHLEVIP